jgi:hypothetical protein
VALREQEGICTVPSTTKGSTKVNKTSRSTVYDGEVTWQRIADEVGLSRQGAKHVYNTAILKLQKNKQLQQYWVDLIIEGRATR